MSVNQFSLLSTTVHGTVRESLEIRFGNGSVLPQICHFIGGILLQPLACLAFLTAKINYGTCLKIEGSSTTMHTLIRF